MAICTPVRFHPTNSNAYKKRVDTNSLPPRVEMPLFTTIVNLVAEWRLR